MRESVVECVRGAMEILRKSHPQPTLRLTRSEYDSVADINGGKPFYTIDHRLVHVM